MKQLAIVCIAIMVCGMAFAGTTQRGDYVTPFDPATTWLNDNEHIYHGHEYDQSKYKSPIGLELDTTLYETDTFGIPTAYGVDTSYDFNNGVWGVMGKVSINLSPTIKKLLNRY